MGYGLFPCLQVLVGHYRPSGSGGIFHSDVTDSDSQRMVWHLNRVVAGVGIAAPLIILIASPIGWFVVASVLFGNESTSWVLSGRFSPTISYHVDENLPFWGGAASTYTYKIYRNPRMLPFLEKEVKEGSAPCSNASSISIQLGRNEHSVVMRCDQNGGKPLEQEFPLP
jgi:hypothetical protein